MSESSFTTLDDAGRPVTKPCEETRIWKKIGGHWKHVHFHRSPLA